MAAITAVTEGAILAIIAAPRAGLTAFDRLDPDAVRIRIAAPPVDGAANAALLRFLADALDVPRTNIQLAAGASGRRKRVLFVGLTPEELGRRLAVHLPPNRTRLA